MRFERTRIEAGRLDGRLVGTGECFDMAADAIFKAVGQRFENADPLVREMQAGTDRIKVDAQFRTQTAGVYAGGDCVAAGVDLTVQAVQHGKLAAQAIHQDIMAATTSATTSGAKHG
jgi:glutamate synthase (NADPH/NADH) small chain